MRCSLGVAGVCALLTHQMAYAARPFDTDDAGTVAPGTFEAEIGSQSWQRNLALCTSLKHGLTERMDLTLSTGYTEYPESNRVFDNAQISAKFSLIPNLFSASVTTEVGTSEYTVRAILSKSFDNFHVNMNLGGDFTGNERDANLEWKFAPSQSIDRFVVGAELLGNQHEAQCWKAGGQYMINERFAADLGIGSTLVEHPDWRITAGFWFAFPTIEKKGT